MTSTTDSATAEAARAPAAAVAARSLLVNIDNGGTLTDICVIDGARVHRSKTLTTPHDLSQCLFDGLKKASAAVYGKEDLQALLLATAAIRYSTTQGTNALVERKGPRLGLLLGGGLGTAALRNADGAADLYDGLVQDRAIRLDANVEAEAFEAAAVRAVGALAGQGANRLIVSIGGLQCHALEAQLKRRLLRTFPPHLLGALPILYAHELADDSDDVRRTWTALFNAFLHPAMERFLYAAEHKLREARSQSPLLVFRNDGYSGRVAKTIAVKTYSSGPRGGMEGAKALAAHHGFARLLSMDVGGTTTDIGLVENGVVRATARGRIEGVETSFPLCDVVSSGVGGSSIFKLEAGQIHVGPESVGSAPGPACFGLGGTKATMTDAFLLGGLLDAASFFGGDLKLDVERARHAVRSHLGTPLGLSDEQAVEAMEAAWVDKIAASLRDYAALTPETAAHTTLAAFGGGGPFVACRIADAVGLSRIVIPGLAAVFSAYGIGFSDIGHSFAATLPRADDAALRETLALLRQRAARSMYGEGADLPDCRVNLTLQVNGTGTAQALPLTSDHLPVGLPSGAQLSVELTAIKPVAHATMTGRFGGATAPAVSQGHRNVLVSGAAHKLPLYRVDDQRAGARAAGPAVLEEAYFTCRIDAGWAFEINDAGDILMSKTEPLK